MTMKRKIDLNGKTVLVTGCPGFIGANLVTRLLREMAGGTVVSLDNMNDYYDVSLKEWRLAQVEKAAESSPVRHVFVKGSIGDKALVDQLFEEYGFDVVVNLAAQAGVRYSIDHPDVYIESNIIGFYNILEACRHHPVEHLVYASSSSVYGGNKKVPFSTEDKVDNPVSLYAATKKSNELLAHAYSKLYDIPSTGLRFFTVYGPAGRPDMFYYSATQKLAAGEDHPDLQLRRYAQGLHLYRRYRGRRPAGDAGGAGEEEGGGRAADSALRGIQHRGRAAGEPAGLYQHAAGGAGAGRSAAGGL